MQRGGCGIDWVLRDKAFFAFLLFMAMLALTFLRSAACDYLSFGLDPARR